MSDLQARLLLCSFDVMPGPTGFSRRMTEYLKGLAARFSVVVLSTKTQDVSHIERYHGSRLLRVPVGTGDLASRLQTFERAIKRQLESEEYALAHFTDPFGGYVLSELRHQYGFRLIYEANSFPSQDLPFTSPELGEDKRMLAKIRRQELYCLMNADLVLTSTQVGRNYIQSLGVNPDLVRLLRAPVDLGPYTAKVIDEPTGEPMRLLYLGSQASWQGLPTLLRALQRAATQVNVRLTVVGPPPRQGIARIDEWVDQLQLRDRVSVLPPVPHDELHKVVGAADVGVVPLEDLDRNRLFGGELAKISEYLAGQRPVIAADLPVTRELLTEGGVFFKPGNVEELAARIVDLATHPRLRAELGARGRTEAIRYLDASIVRGKLLSIYDELLGRRPRQAVADLGQPTLTGTPTSRVLRSASDSAPVRVPVSSTDPYVPLGSEGDLSKRDTDPSVPPLPPAERAAARALSEGRPQRELRTPVRTRLPSPSAIPGTDPEGHPVGMSAPPPPLRMPGTNPPRPPVPHTETSAPELATPAAAAPAQPAAPAPPPIPPGLNRAAPAPAPAAPRRPSGSFPSPFAATQAPAPAGATPPPIPPPLRRSTSGVFPSPTNPPPLTVSNTPTSPAASAITSSPPPVPQAATTASADDELDFVAAAPPLPPLKPQTIPPLPPRPPERAPKVEEPEEISPDEVVDAADELRLPPSRVDPWLAQLAHGYCPPEGIQFARPPPPTNFPGKDTPPATPPAPPLPKE